MLLSMQPNGHRLQGGVEVDWLFALSVKPLTSDQIRQRLEAMSPECREHFISKVLDDAMRLLR